MKNSWMAMGLAAAVACAGCAARENTRSTGEYIDDATITTKVKTELIGAKEVKSADISVRTYNGEVQLSGFVDSPDQKSRAEQIARAVPGVKDVQDDLLIKTASTAQAPVQEAAGAQTPAAQGSSTN